MKKALILHAYQNNPDGHWYPWLKQELEKKGYEVWIPLLPTMDSDHPDAGEMLKVIEAKKFVDINTVVVGHNLGSVLALRLAERIPFKTGIIFAGWDINDLDPRDALFWPTPLDHQKIKDNVQNWIVPISHNDPYISYYMTERMAERLNGTVIDEGNKGHFTTQDGITEVPEILKFV